MKKLHLTKNTAAFLLVLTPLLVAEVATANSDRDATSEERAKVVEVLQEMNCTSVDDVDYIQGIGFEAEDVKCNDGKEYDIFLNDDFNITSQREDLD